MNTFATLLLAFPFYLAMKGKLASYIALAKPDASSGTVSQASTSTPTANGLGMVSTPSAPSAPAAPTTSDMASMVSNVTHIFGDVAAIASL